MNVVSSPGLLGKPGGVRWFDALDHAKGNHFHPFIGIVGSPVNEYMFTEDRPHGASRGVGSRKFDRSRDGSGKVRMELLDSIRVSHLGASCNSYGHIEVMIHLTLTD